MSIGSLYILQTFFTFVKGYFSNFQGGRKRTLADIKGLDEKDRRIVQYVQQFHATQGHAPSLDEIGDFMGMTKPGAAARIRKLIRAGWLTRKGRQSRTLRAIRTV